MPVLHTNVISELHTGKHPVKTTHGFVATGQLHSNPIINKQIVRNKSELPMKEEEKLPLKNALW